MRRLSKLLVAGMAAALLAAPGTGRQPDNQIDAKSVELLRQGQTLFESGKLVEADDALETALAVDPRNRQAFVLMAQVANKQGLFGQAIRFTNRALELEPTDRTALVVQGEAMVELGATARARANLEKLKKLCPSGCAEISALNSAITQGPTVAQAKTPAAKSN